jgi:hypothetical protein
LKRERHIRGSDPGARDEAERGPKLVADLPPVQGHVPPIVGIIDPKAAGAVARAGRTVVRAEQEQIERQIFVAAEG